MPKSLCFTENVPVAVSDLASSRARTGTVIDFVVPVDRQLAGDAEIDLRFASTGPRQSMCSER